MKRFISEVGVVPSEVLIVIVLLSVLVFSVVFLIGDRGADLSNTQNSKRYIDVWTLVDAVHQYTIDNADFISTYIPLAETEICLISGDDCFGYVDLSLLIEKNTYLSAIPEDPENSSIVGSGYTIYRSEDNRITVTAPMASDKSISITK